MRVTTDENGKTTCGLTSAERRAMRAAKTAFEQLAFHLRETEASGVYTTIADAIGALLRQPNNGGAADDGRTD